MFDQGGGDNDKNVKTIFVTRTTAMQEAFVTRCFTEAFTSEGIMKADYQCSDDDMLYAGASIGMF